MKQFLMFKEDKTCLVVELSYYDIWKILMGREVDGNNGGIVIRNQTAYEAMNLAAPAVETK
jgi:hypothetical protein